MLTSPLIVHKKYINKVTTQPATNDAEAVWSNLQI